MSSEVQDGVGWQSLAAAGGSGGGNTTETRAAAQQAGSSGGCCTFFVMFSRKCKGSAVEGTELTVFVFRRRQRLRQKQTERVQEVEATANWAFRGGSSVLARRWHSGGSTAGARQKC